MHLVLGRSLNIFFNRLGHGLSRSGRLTRKKKKKKNRVGLGQKILTRITMSIFECHVGEIILFSWIMSFIHYSTKKNSHMFKIFKLGYDKKNLLN